MGKRPLCIFSCIFLAAVFLFWELFQPGVPEGKAGAGRTAVVGEVYYREEGTNSSILYLKDVQESKSPQRAYLKHVIVYLSKEMFYPIGTVLKIEGTLYPTEKPRCPGQFDERSYYLGKGISHKLFGKSVSVLREAEWNFREQLFCLREALCARLEYLFEEEEAAVLKAMLFGESSGIPEELEESYQTAGIGHLLAISGLHVTILGGTLYHILRKTGLPYPVCASAAGGILLCYQEMLGLRVSALRAVGMFLVFLLAETIGRAYDRLTALALLAVVVVVFYPYQMGSAGFLLSFGAAAGAAAALEWLAERERVEKERADGPQSGKQPGKKWLAGILVPLYLQAVTLPVLVWFYYEVSVYALFWNLLLVPLAGIILGSGLLAVGVSFFSRTLGIFAGGPAQLLLMLYRMACQIGEELPGAVYLCGKPKLWQVVVYYAGLAVLTVVCWPGQNLLRSVWQKRRFPDKTNRLLQGVCGGLYLSAFLSLIFLRFPSPLEVTFLDVGQGDCAVIREKQGLSLLVDGGSSDVGQVGKYRILPFLKYSKIPHLNYIFVSHGDADHISGILELLEQQRITVGTLVCWAGGSEKLDGLKEAAGKRGIPVQYMRYGSCLESDTLRLLCLGPTGEQEEETENNQSLILRLESGSLRILLTGDMETEEETAVLEKVSAEFLEAEILKTAHHGSATSTSEMFLEAVRPKAAVISCGEGNSYGHPDAGTMERLKRYTKEVFVTMECGTVKVEWDGRKAKIIPYWFDKGNRNPL